MRLYLNYKIFIKIKKKLSKSLIFIKIFSMFLKFRNLISLKKINHKSKVNIIT